MIGSEMVPMPVPIKVVEKSKGLEGKSDPPVNQQIAAIVPRDSQSLVPMQHLTQTHMVSNQESLLDQPLFGDARPVSLDNGPVITHSSCASQ